MARVLDTAQTTSGLARHMLIAIDPDTSGSLSNATGAAVTHSGALPAGVTSSTIGSYKALAFSGSHTQTQITHASALNAATELTVTAQFVANSLAVDQAVIANWEDSGSVEFGRQFLIHISAAGAVTVGIYAQNGAAYLRKTADGVITAGATNTVSYSWRGGTTLALAVNGAMVALVADVWVSGTPTTMANSMSVGVGNDSLSTSRKLNGKISFATVQRTSFSDAELQSITANPAQIYSSIDAASAPAAELSASGGGTSGGSATLGGTASSLAASGGGTSGGSANLSTGAAGVLTLPVAYRFVGNKDKGAWALQTAKFYVQDTTDGAWKATCTTSTDASGIVAAYQFTSSDYVAGRKYILWPAVGSTLATATPGHGCAVVAA